VTTTKRDLTLTVEDPGATFESEGPDNGTRLYLYHDKERAEWRLNADRVQVYDLPPHPSDGPDGPVRVVRYTLHTGQLIGYRIRLGNATRFSAKQLAAYGGSAPISRSALCPRLLTIKVGVPSAP
jgi:hypothetical protein